MIEPGGSKADFFKNSYAASKETLKEYNVIVGHTGMDKLFEQYKDKLTYPQQAGLFVYEAVTVGTDDFRYLIGDEMKEFLEIKKFKSVEEYIHAMRSHLLP